MADLIVNHVSSHSLQFQDLLERGSQSEYAGMFLTFDRVFPQGATDRDLTAIYRPRPALPFTPIALRDGSRRVFWTTFTSEQIDIDVQHPRGLDYLDRVLQRLAAGGVSVVRLDAIGYAIKSAGKSCFMMPETFEFMDALTARARDLGLEVLVEIHSYYKRQIEIASRVDWIYDFALPPLILHALFSGSAQALAEWIDIRPNNAVTVLDTHDGIGVIDVGADAGDRDASPGLLSGQEIQALVQRIHANSNGESRRATGAAADNLDLYQVNCTFYDALGKEDLRYLLARAIQFFLPGVPQVYYVGLFAGSNDMDLLGRSNVGRDINRHYYSRDEIDEAMSRPVVLRLIELIRLRNGHPAFSGGFSVSYVSDELLELRWQSGEEFAQLAIDFRSLAYRLECSGDEHDSVGRFVAA